MAADPFIGLRVKALMKERDWSQLELARRSGVAYTTISRHVNNKTGVNESNQERYAEAFGIHITELLGDAQSDDQRLRTIQLVLEGIQAEAERGRAALLQALESLDTRLSAIEAELGPRVVLEQSPPPATRGGA